MLRCIGPAHSEIFSLATSTTAPSSVTALVGFQVATPPFTGRTSNPITSIEHRSGRCAHRADSRTAPERGIYAASASKLFSTAKRHECRAPFGFLNPPCRAQNSWRVRDWACLNLVIWSVLLYLRVPGSAANVDESKLPPTAKERIDFTRDIKPILESSCLRCHGPEKPKSRFRLDNREAALKGGENGVDIVPGNSAKSPLILYVAGLVEDMEMPPRGKGQPLTTNQIGLLRAWIDQGVIWEPIVKSNTFLSLSPTFGGIAVTGDKNKFREHYWQKEGFNGGLEQFELIDRKDPETTLAFSGHALPNDFKLALDLDRNEVGFVHSGFSEYRKYFDDTGGYFPPLVQPAPSLGRDLHLDLGKAWIDFGLTLPHWPRMVLGYEYDYKRGEEATTTWNLSGGAAPNVAPSSKNIQEGVHILKFDLDADVRGVTIEERFRGEFYSLNTYRTNSAARSEAAEKVSESNHYFQGANTIRLEKQLRDWLLASGGYLYSKLNADASFTDTIDNVGVPGVASVPKISLEKQSHVFNLNALFGPFSGLTLSTSVQSEWTRQKGFGSGNLNQINTTAPIAALPILFSTLVSDYDESSVMENVALRYTKIPFTVLFAEARLQQQSLGRNDADLQSSGNFLENTTLTSQLSDLRLGFHTSPWRPVSLSAHYRRYEDDSHNQTNQPSQPPGGYPGFIRSRNLVTDEAEAKLAWQLCAWFKATLSYQFLTTAYRTDTGAGVDPITLITVSPGGSLLAGREDSHVFSINGTLSPTRRL